MTVADDAAKGAGAGLTEPLDAEQHELLLLAVVDRVPSSDAASSQSGLKFHALMITVFLIVIRM